MFYTYALPFDSAGAVQYSPGVLGVASTQVAVSTERTTGIPLSVAALSPQTAFHTLTGIKLFGYGGTSSAAVQRLRGIAPPTIVASQTQSAHVSTRNTFSLLIQALLSAIATVYFPRLNYSVLAARSPNVAHRGRGYGLAFGVNTPSNWFSDEFTDEFGVGVGGHAESLLKSVNSVGGGTSTQSSTLASGIRKLIGLASASSALILRGPGRIPKAVSSSVARRLLQPAKLVGAAVGEASGIARAAGVSKHVTSSQSPLLSFGGNLYARIARTASAQTLGLRRGVSATRSAGTRVLGSVQRSVGKLIGGAGALTAGLIVTVRVVRSLVTQSNLFSDEFTNEFGPGAAGNVQSLTKSVNLIRSTSGSSAAAIITVAAHLLAALQALQTLVAGLSAPSAALGYLKNLAVTQASVARLSSQQAYYRLLSATQTQGGTLVRGLGYSAATLMTSAVAGVKSVGKSVSFAASSTGSVVTYSAHALLLGVGMVVSQAALRAARSFRGAATAQSASVSLGTGKIVPEIVGAVSASAASIVRLTMKLLGAVSRQIITHIRGVVSLTLPPAIQIQATGSRASRVVYLIAVQPQRGRLVSWFHLFVPDWAYQQTVLLPPSGGPAEPPAFGAIDPADQTTFAFDWSARADFNDPIVSATVTSSPPGMSFLGPVFTGGTLVEVTVLPFAPKQLPTVYRLRCTAVFASGRRSSFSIPVPVRTL